uniref:Uncharacterized protein n=1 Tax=Lactuca sativa TaxID=4236 RepID=A0A9R1V268_LACSA|nr:hypothetical protein LSAT_V11C700368120 [Lactuca sativa]
MNGSNLWLTTPYEKPLPPMSRRMPGRPTVNRKQHAREKGDGGSRKRTTKKTKKTKVLSAYSQVVADLREFGYISQEIEELMGTRDDVTQETITQETVQLPTMDDVTFEAQGIEETQMDDVTFVPETIAPGSTLAEPMTLD